MRALAIVPAWNEEHDLPGVIADLRRAVPSWDICVVDDGSTDATAAVAREAGALVLSLPINLGIGGAVQTGYLWARKHGYEVAAQIDGDGQHDPQYLTAALRTIVAGTADLVVGSRYLGAGGFQSTAVRRMGTRYLSWFLRLRCGARVTDPTSGFRVADRHLLYAQPAPNRRRSRWRSGAGCAYRRCRSSCGSGNTEPAASGRRGRSTTWSRSRWRSSCFRRSAAGPRRSPDDPAAAAVRVAGGRLRDVARLLRVGPVPRPLQTPE